MPRPLIDHFTLELCNSKIQVMYLITQWDILVSRPFIHLERCSVRTKLIIYFSLFGSICWVLLWIFRQVSAQGNCCFSKLFGRRAFTGWWILDGIKTFPTYFINEKRVDHFNTLSRIQSAQHGSMLFPTTFSASSLLFFKAGFHKLHALHTSFSEQPLSLITETAHITFVLFKLTSYCSPVFRHSFCVLPISLSLSHL